MNLPSPDTFIRLLRWLAIAVITIGVVVALVVVRAVSGWKADSAREIAAIEASGAPVMPEDLELVSSTGPPWWETIDWSKDPIDDLQLNDAASLRALLDDPGADLAPFGRPLLASLAVLYVELEAAGESVDGAWLDLYERSCPSDPEDTVVHPGVDSGVFLLARVELAATRALIESAGTACDGRPFDAGGWIGDWLASDEVVPRPTNVRGLLRIQKSVAKQAWLAALDGDADTALQAVGLGFRVARALDAAPGVLHFLAWSLQTEYAVDALVRVAHFLPDLELAELGPDVARLDPRPRFVQALEAERAIGLRTIELSKDRFSTESLWPPSPRTIVPGLYLTYDRWVYLENYALLVAAARAPQDEVRAILDTVDRDLEESSWALHTSFLVPFAATGHEIASDLETRIEQTRNLLLTRAK